MTVTTARPQISYSQVLEDHHWITHVPTHGAGEERISWQYCRDCPASLQRTAYPDGKPINATFQPDPADEQDEVSFILKNGTMTQVTRKEFYADRNDRHKALIEAGQPLPQLPQYSFTEQDPDHPHRAPGLRAYGIKGIPLDQVPPYEEFLANHSWHTRITPGRWKESRHWRCSKCDMDVFVEEHGVRASFYKDTDFMYMFQYGFITPVSPETFFGEDNIVRHGSPAWDELMARYQQEEDERTARARRWMEPNQEELDMIKLWTTPFEETIAQHVWTIKVPPSPSESGNMYSQESCIDCDAFLARTLDTQGNTLTASLRQKDAPEHERDQRFILKDGKMCRTGRSC